MRVTTASDVSLLSRSTYASERHPSLYSMVDQSLALGSQASKSLSLADGLDKHASRQISEVHILKVIEQHRIQLLQQVQEKHECLVKDIKSLNAVGEASGILASASHSVSFAPAAEDHTPFDKGRDANGQARADTTSNARPPPSFSPKDRPVMSDILPKSALRHSRPAASVSNPGLEEEAKLGPEITSYPGERADLNPSKLGRHNDSIVSSLLSVKKRMSGRSSCNSHNKYHTSHVHWENSESSSKGVDFSNSESSSKGVEFSTPEGSRLAHSNAKINKMAGHNRSYATSLKEPWYWQFLPKSWRERLRKRREAQQRRTGPVRLRHVMRTEKRFETPVIDAVVGFVIVCNAFVMIFQTQWQGYQTSTVLGFESDNSSWPHAEISFDVLEHIFTAIFIIELLVRVFLSGVYYLRDLYSIFDLTLVVTSIIDLYILQPMGQGGQGNLMFVRLARVTRFFRVLRIVRVMKLFASLRILVKTIHSSSRALIWSMVLLGIIMVIFGMLFCQLLTDWIRDDKNDRRKREWVFEHYGSSSRAVYTMFEATLSGCWPNYARPLLEISDWYAVVYVFYVAVVVFAVIRIITALFLKETLQNAYDDADMMINEQLKKKSSYLEKLAQAFEAMDESGDGTVTWEEFDDMLKNPNVKAYLSVLDLEVHETWTLFDLLDNGDGLITYAEFLAGVLRLKGQARAIDLICLQRDMTQTHEAVVLMMRQLGIDPAQANHRKSLDPEFAKKRALKMANLPLDAKAHHSFIDLSG